jgi:hypothetical protein
MAQRRMFSKTITNSSQFLMMPQSSQNLYFHLGMNADDDGFCEHFTIMRMTESKPDDLKILQAKNFISVFDDKVLVIIDWKENNYLRADRYTASKYLAIYKDEISRLTSGIPMVDEMATQDRLGKDRKGKVIDDKQSLSTNKINYSEEDLELANHLLELIRKNTPTFKEPNIETWADHIRLMRERDNRTSQQIKFVIDWCQKDNFWSANILSTKKLREKFDTLVSQIKRNADKDKIKINSVLI